jgi:uncharacterized protein (TIGR01619 family)
VPPWEQDFDAYLAELDEAPASFMIDLGAYAHAPLDSHPTRVQVRVPMTSPRDDGLRSSGEAEALGELEERIIEALEERCGAVFVGHTISEGMLHIVCYAPAEQTTDPAALFDEFDARGYELAWFVEDDAEWEMYFEFLFPDPRSMQIIQNRRLMKVRAEHGDDPSKVRTIDHTALFEDLGSAEEAAVVLAGKGFRVDPVREDEEYWLLEFHRDDALDGDAPDRICLEIIDLLEPFAGYYDGWGAPVVRAALN